MFVLFVGCFLLPRGWLSLVKFSWRVCWFVCLFAGLVWLGVVAKVVVVVAVEVCDLFGGGSG